MRIEPKADAPEPMLDWRLSVNDFIAAFPETFPVFMEYGVETCCGGSMSVADAARAYGIPESELGRVLRQAIDDARCPSAARHSSGPPASRCSSP